MRGKLRSDPCEDFHGQKVRAASLRTEWRLVKKFSFVRSCCWTGSEDLEGWGTLDLPQDFLGDGFPGLDGTV